MSKDFEAEYQEYLNLNTPDLWSRIEAGVDAVEAEQKSESEKVVKFPVWKMATIVAACIAVIICIPSLGIMRLGFGGSKYEESATADTSMMAECETACEEEVMADNVAEDTATETTTEETTKEATEAIAESTVESTVEEEAAEDAGISDYVSEKDILEVNVVQVEVLGNEIRYTAVNMDTEEEIMIIQMSDAPSMQEGNNYTICVTKEEQDIYCFEALVVE